jgi:hypothetical protein
VDFSPASCALVYSPVRVFRVWCMTRPWPGGNPTAAKYGMQAACISRKPRILHMSFISSIVSALLAERQAYDVACAHQSATAVRGYQPFADRLTPACSAHGKPCLCWDRSSTATRFVAFRYAHRDFTARARLLFGPTHKRDMSCRQAKRILVGPSLPRYAHA